MSKSFPLKFSFLSFRLIVRSLRSKNIATAKVNVFLCTRGNLWDVLLFLSAMCNVNLVAMWVFLISRIFRPWHFEQRTKKNYWRHCFTLFTQLPFWILEFVNLLENHCILSCVSHRLYALVLHSLDVLLVLFIWTLGKNLSTFFFCYTVNISFSQFDLIFPLYRSIPSLASTSCMLHKL